MRNFKTLPGKPSELLRLAMHDLTLIEKDPNYKVNMSVWHTGSNSLFPACEVCLAGAVMAKSLGVRRRGVYTPKKCNIPVIDAFREIQTEDKLRALDAFRTGHIGGALTLLGYDPIDYQKLIPRRKPSYYDEEPEQFHIDMETIAKDLEAAGL
jgi:hypothetical protein